MLNAAYQCLREPKERLKHLLALELGAKPPELQQVPPELMDLFLKVSNLSREVDRFLAKSAEPTSALLKVGRLERSQDWLDQLATLQQTVQGRYDQLLEETRTIDEGWDSAGQADSAGRREVLRRLEEIYRLLSYYGRWLGQLQERKHRLVVSYA